MVAVDLKSLVGRLNDLCRRSLESAAGLTLSRSNFNVEIEHWLLKILEASDADLIAILRHFEIEPARLAADLTRVLDRLKTGNTRAPALSPHIVQLAREAWMLASLDYGASRVRSGHLLCALLSEESLAPLAREASAQLARIQPDQLRRELSKLTASTGEAASKESGGPGGSEHAGIAVPVWIGQVAYWTGQDGLENRARRREILRQCGLAKTREDRVLVPVGSEAAESCGVHRADFLVPEWTAVLQSGASTLRGLLLATRQDPLYTRVGRIAQRLDIEQESVDVAPASHAVLRTKPIVPQTEIPQIQLGSLVRLKRCRHKLEPKGQPGDEVPR